ncbi:hypothetical protein [Streptomyces sp. NPDC005303]|uniref:hypothetical protein n=1 Tax=Streptomyces sp. NPDC005303 TaxID=3155713 RepID=UPI0033BB6885
MAVLLLMRSTVVFLGLEIGAAVLLYVTQNVWVTLLVYPLVYLLSFFLLALLVPGVEEEPKAWAIVALITVPIGALAVMHLTYSGLDQRALHAHGRQERATVTDVYWSNGGADPPTHVARLADPWGRSIPGIVSGDGLKAGQTLTVTVDTEGRIPVMVGTASTGSGKFRTAGITAVAEILFLALAVYQGTADRSAQETTDKPKRTRKPKGVPA